MNRRALVLALFVFSLSFGVKLMRTEGQEAKPTGLPPLTSVDTMPFEAADNKIINGQPSPGDAPTDAPAETPAPQIAASDSSAIAPLEQTPAALDIFTLVVGFTYMDTGGPKMCTAIIVRRDRALTAGHCGCGFPETYRVSMVEDVLHAPEDMLLKIDGAPILFDPQQCQRADFAPRPGKDLALLQLHIVDKGPDCGQYVNSKGKKVDTDPCPDGFKIDVMNLRPELTPGRTLTITGFGETETGSKGLRFNGGIPILSPDCVGERFGQVCAPFEEMILSSALAGRRTDSCKGDSGGPVFLTRGDQQILVAITSRGTPGLFGNREACGGGGIYTLLGRRSVRDWLDLHGVGGAMTGKPVATTTAASASNE